MERCGGAGTWDTHGLSHPGNSSHISLTALPALHVRSYRNIFAEGKAVRLICHLPNFRTLTR
eukprot:scaffold44456_cov56-Phaeocystis_antarctica.AAC.1